MVFIINHWSVLTAFTCCLSHDITQRLSGNYSCYMNRSRSDHQLIITTTKQIETNQRIWYKKKRNMMGSSTVQSLVWGPNVAQKQIYFWPLTYFFTIFKASLINHFWSPTHIVSVSVSSVRSPVLSGSSSSSTWNSSTLSRSVCSSASGKASWEMCLWGSPAKRWQMNLTMWNRIFHRMNFFFFSFKWSFLGWLHWKKNWSKPSLISLLLLL